MDERAYHTARQAIAAPPCVFARAILAGCAQCELSRKRAMAEREVVTCTSSVAHINCATLDGLLRERAFFALRLPRQNAPIVHAKVMKLHCGGLRGIQAALSAAQPDVHQMVQQAMLNGASLLDLPWAAIVASAAAWQLRQRSPPPPVSAAATSSWPPSPE